MQSIDHKGNVVGMNEVDFSRLNDLVGKIRKLEEEKGATHHVIGKLPKAGENIEIHGLSYRVDFADFVKGKYVVKLTCRDK